MLTYKHVSRQEDAGRSLPVPPPPSSSFLCSQSMLSYLTATTTDVNLLDRHRLSHHHHHHHRRSSDRSTDVSVGGPTTTPTAESDSVADPALFPWHPPADSDLRHYANNISNSNNGSSNSIFQQRQPLTLSDYTSSATRIYPSAASYFRPAPPTPAVTGNFFPFVPQPPTVPPPSRHYLQIESYSAILASMGGRQGPPPPLPTRPTPIFSMSSDADQTQFGLRTVPQPHVVHFSPQPPRPPTSSLYVSGTTPSTLSPTTTTSSPVSSATADDTASVLTPPCQSPSSSCRPAGSSYPLGSLKHRILVRPDTKDDDAELDVVADAAAAVVVGGKRNRRRNQSPKSSPTPTPVPARTLMVNAGGATVPLKSTSEAIEDGQSAGQHQDIRQRRQQQQQQQLRYPAHFMKGSVIELANGELRCVEDLRTEDFVNSAELSADLCIDSSTVVRIDERAEGDELSPSTAALTFLVGNRRIQVTVEASSEHPFFVFGQGWSSCCPERTMKRYALQCHRLQVGDVCISLTHRHGGRRQQQPQLLPLPLDGDEPNRTRPSRVLTYPKMRKVVGLLPATAMPRMRRKRRWSASDAVTTADAGASSSEHIRSMSLADASDDGSAT